MRLATCLLSLALQSSGIAHVALYYGWATHTHTHTHTHLGKSAVSTSTIHVHSCITA